jgi:hypothetical protein
MNLTVQAFLHIIPEDLVHTLLGKTILGGRAFVMGLYFRACPDPRTVVRFMECLHKSFKSDLNRC